MKIQKFNILIAALTAGFLSGITFPLAAQGPMENPELYDSYGGRTDMHIQKGTGYFDLGTINGKYFFVTPEGNAFRSIGLNHSHTLTTNDYDSITAELFSMGFNSGDYQGHNWQWNRLPYTQGINLVNICRWQSEAVFSFEDVFDPAFLTSLDTKIKNIVQPQADNANLICYFFTDIPVWNEEKYGTSWIDFYSSLPEDSPGGTQWKQWKAANPGTADKEFLPVIARKLYTEAIAILKKYDSNHLIFSDRYLEYTFYDPVVEEIVSLVDGIAIQPKNLLSFAFFDEVYEKYQKPIFVADHVTSFATAEYPNTMGQVAENVDDYLDYYRWSVFNVMAEPYMVGYNKCQFQDQFTGTVLKQGLFKENGDPYPYLDSLYDVHTSALDTAYTVPKFDMEGVKKNSATGVGTSH